MTSYYVGVRGAMSALYLRDLGAKTRRGLEGRVRNGRSRRRQLVWLQRRAPARPGRSAGHRREDDQPERGRGRAPRLRRVRRWQEPKTDCEGTERRLHPGARWRRVGLLDNPRQCDTSHRPAAQRAVSRENGLEPLRVSPSTRRRASASPASIRRASGSRRTCPHLRIVDDELWQAVQAGWRR